MKLLATLMALATAACGAPPPPAPPPIDRSEPHWQDVLDATPELLVIVRPRALRRDKVYGPLLRRAIEAARQQSRVVAATRVLDALEDAGELVVALRLEAPDRAGELVLIERGVPGDVDPGALVDDDGRPVWSPGPSGRVRELVRERDDHGHPLDASLFELPGRTWIIATGDARGRAREALGHPFGRPPIDPDPTALAVVRIDGPSLVSRVHALQDLGGLSAVGHHLRSVTLALPPGGEGSVMTTLVYDDEDAAALAEVATQQVLAVLKRRGSNRLSWLVPARVERPGKQLVLTSPLPPGLIDALLHAGSAPLPLDVDVPAP